MPIPPASSPLWNTIVPAAFTSGIWLMFAANSPSVSAIVVTGPPLPA